MHRDADRAGLVGNRTRHGLANPPGRIRRELEALAVIELLDGPNQTERTLLDQIKEGQTTPKVALGNRDDEAQVGLDHLTLGSHVAFLDPLRQIDLHTSRQERHTADLTQVQAQ